MKLVLDKWGCCVSNTCIFRKECAQHETAGDFRSEDGFAPDIKGSECLTGDEARLYTERMDTDPLPASYDNLERGFRKLNPDRLQDTLTTLGMP